MSPVSDELRAWYQGSLVEKADELDGMLAALAGGDDGAAASIRALAHKLRGSGASFGFPEVGEAGHAAERADGDGLAAAGSALAQVIREAAARE